jgi:uncharacterized membrane protein YbhN (UPF0104 family)
VLTDPSEPSRELAESKNGETTEDQGKEARRRLRNGLIALVILVAMVAGLLLAVPGLSSVKHAVAHMNGNWIEAAVFLELFSCLGYVVAFLQVFERAPIRLGARVALSELAFNAAVSLGGGGGAAVGAWLLVERGGSVSRVAERSVVLFLLTSAINVITFALVGLLLFAGALPGPSNPLLSALPAGVGTIVFVVFALLPQILERGPARRLPRRILLGLDTLAESIHDTLKLLRTPDWRIVGAIGYLWFDMGVLLACFAAAGVHPPLASVVLAYQLAYMSNVIPVPGGIGVLDGSMVGALVLYGISATTATAAVLVYHAIALWIPALWGTVAFLILRRSRHEPLQLRPTRAERKAMRSARRVTPARESSPESPGSE